MEAASQYRRWDELVADALGLIFSKISVHDRVTVIPRVCKSWAKAVSRPICWQEINLLKWSNHCQPDQLHRMVKMLEMLIARSSGSLRTLCVSGLKSDSIFTFIAENAGCLQKLVLPKCNMRDPLLEQIAGRLSMITFLDVSYCVKMSARGLEVIGKNCKLLEVLCRNMKPSDIADKPFQDDEAKAIASTMPNLRCLEMAYNRITTEGVRQILSGCPKLKSLDLFGCFAVDLGDIFRKQRYPELMVMGPLVADFYDGGNEWQEKEIESVDLLEEMAWQFRISDMIEDRDYPSHDGGEGILEFEECGLCWCPSP